MARFIGAFTIFLFFNCASMWAQTSNPGGLTQQVELGVATGSGSILLHTSYLRTYELGSKSNIKLGYGLRFSWFRSFDAQEYVTAPTRVRTGKEGLQSLWSSSVAARLDTFITENPVIGSVNLGLYAAYFFNPLLEVGLYAEIIGFSFGAEQDGIYNSPNQENIPLTASANPEKFNALPASRGAYQAEFFARYWISPHVGWKAGLNLHHSVYITEQALNFGNQRFKNVSAFFSVSISYRWGSD